MQSLPEKLPIISSDPSLRTDSSHDRKLSQFQQRPRRKRIFQTSQQPQQRMKVRVQVTDQHYECPVRFASEDAGMNGQSQANELCAGRFCFDPDKKYLRTVVPADHCQQTDFIMAKHDRELMEQRPLKQREPSRMTESPQVIQYRYLSKELILHEDDLKLTASYNAFMIPTQKVYVREDSRAADASETVSQGSYEKHSDSTQWTSANSRSFHYEQRHLLDSRRHY